MYGNDIGLGFLLGFVVTLVACILIVDCGGCTVGAHGQEWEKCYPNKTCDEKLTCLKNKCVDFTFDAGVKKNECTAEFCTLE